MPASDDEILAVLAGELVALAELGADAVAETLAQEPAHASERQSQTSGQPMGPQRFVHAKGAGGVSARAASSSSRLRRDRRGAPAHE